MPTVLTNRKPSVLVEWTTNQRLSSFTRAILQATMARSPPSNSQKSPKKVHVRKKTGGKPLIKTYFQPSSAVKKKSRQSPVLRVEHDEFYAGRRRVDVMAKITRSGRETHMGNKENHSFEDADDNQRKIRPTASASFDEDIMPRSVTTKTTTLRRKRTKKAYAAESSSEARQSMDERPNERPIDVTLLPRVHSGMTIKQLQREARCRGHKRKVIPKTTMELVELLNEGSVLLGETDAYKNFTALLAELENENPVLYKNALKHAVKDFRKQSNPLPEGKQRVPDTGRQAPSLRKFVESSSRKKEQNPQPLPKLTSLTT